MGWITAAAIGIGMASSAYGARQNRKAGEDANAANLEQQRRSMAWQKGQETLAMGDIDEAQRGMAERIMGGGIRTMGNMLGQAAMRGWQPGSAMSLSMQRGGAMDTKNQLATAYSNLGQTRAGIRMNQSFPLIQTTAQMDSSWGQMGGMIASAGIANMPS